MSHIQNIATTADLQQVLMHNRSKLVVVDFYATWCKPCTIITPFYVQLSDRFKTVLFTKVDVDHAQEVAALCGVSSMPTFQFYKDGKRVADMKGANAQQLEYLVKIHSGEGSPINPDHLVDTINLKKKNVGVPGYMDLIDYITVNQMDALNEQEEHSVKNIFRNDDTYLESDVDEQLIISVPFNQPVKLHSLKIKVPNHAQAPKTIKLYANRQTLGFDEADSIKETQIIHLEPKDFEEGAVISLRFVKFQNITNIMLFVVDNQEEEETTQIQHLMFIG
ncbi:PITH domain-containing protein [Pilobolus umbonatus]|nr:PITH domain-containing protein [Pilobolus umbonatus]